MKFYSILLSLILLSFLACTEETATPIPSNNNLLFKNTFLIDIKVENDSLNLPVFNLPSIEKDLIFIAVSKEQLRVVAHEIQNKDAIIWSWNSGLNNNGNIRLVDGILADSIKMMNTSHSTRSQLLRPTLLGSMGMG